MARLRATDIAGHALAAFSGSTIREVVVLGRRGPGQAAFTVPELLELQGLEDVDIVIDAEPELLRDAGDGSHPLRAQLLRELADRAQRGCAKRLVLRFLASPVAILGHGRVTGLTLVRNRLAVDGTGTLRAEPTDDVQELSAGLVLRSIGYRAAAPSSLPWDPSTGTVPNRDGRVTREAGGTPLVGVYVAGWLKRGPSGFIGTNKQCAQQTIGALLEDAAAGQLLAPRQSRRDFDALLAHRQPAQVGYAGWKRIDRAECALGAELGRPRRRFVRWDELLSAAV